MIINILLLATSISSRGAEAAAAAAAADKETTIKQSEINKQTRNHKNENNYNFKKTLGHRPCLQTPVTNNEM